MPDQNYSQYTLSDFLDDQSFIRWVTLGEPETDRQWNTFLSKYPEKKALIKQASAIIKTYRRQEEFTNESRKEEIWNRINDTVHRHQILHHEKNVRPLYLKVAAAVAILVLGTAAFWLMQESKNIISTTSNEVTTITLPDNSIVTLNANSTLRYDKEWKKESIREVWLEGEAYFNVKHINMDTSSIVPHHRFIVHSNKVNIEVLGTSFNVRNNKDQIKITLITGKVKVEPVDKTDQSSKGLIMLPGDYVEFNNKNLIVKKKIDKPHQAMTWINQDFAFNNAYVKDIIEKLQHDHGYTVEVKDPTLLEMRIEGEISVSSVQELLSTISAALDLKIDRRDDKHIIISRPNEP
jgi:ferric-dicitrate binding protein FerR (iron transport regulator)